MACKSIIYNEILLDEGSLEFGDQVGLEFFALQPFKLNGTSLNVEFSCDSSSLCIESCGVHLMHKHAENAKDHSNVL